MDLSKLTTSDKLILGGGIAYLIFMFFPWYGLAGGSNNGWDYFLGGVLPLILIVVMCLQVALTRFSPDTNLPTLPLSWGQVHLIAGGVAAVLVILRLIIGSSIDAGIVEIDLDRKFGLILATLAAIAVAIGGYLKFQESGGTEAAGGPSTGTAPF